MKKEKNKLFKVDDKKKIFIIDPKNLLIKYTKGQKDFNVSVNDRYSKKKDTFEWRYEDIYNPCATQGVTILLKDGTLIKLPREKD